MEVFLADNALPENDYPTLKEPVEAEDEPIQNDREGRNDIYGGFTGGECTTRKRLPDAERTSRNGR